MRRLCTICVRGGSRGVPGKNLRPFAGKPLLVHSIEQACASALVDAVAVSSDSEAILDIARQAGVDVAIRRPDELATDSAPKVPAIRHALEEAERALGWRADVLVDLDATAPLRVPEDIVATVRLLEESGAASVITGAPARRSPYFNLVERRADGTVALVKESPAGVARRQDAPACFDMNASVYAWRAETFRRDPRVFYPDTRLHEMPEERSIDIDSELDWRVAEALAGRRGRFDLGGRVAVLTGACGILGRKLAAGLAEAGAAVAAIDLDAAACDALAAELASRHGIASVGVRCDVSKPDEVARMVEAVEARLGPIDVLLNNAASRTDDRARFLAPVDRYELETWRAVNAVNLDGLFLVAQAIGSRMARRGRGSIVQTASIYGVVAPDARVYEGSEYHGMAITTPPVYSASKAAVIGLTRHLAATWGPKGVRVNALTPGGIFSGQNEEFQRRYGARTPLGRMAEADEMVGAAIFLASDASSYVTGHNLVVDGGFTIW